MARGNFFVCLSVVKIYSFHKKGRTRDCHPLPVCSARPEHSNAAPTSPVPSRLADLAPNPEPRPQNHRKALRRSLSSFSLRRSIGFIWLARQFSSPQFSCPQPSSSESLESLSSELSSNLFFL